MIPLAITGLGAVTAVGDDVDGTCASVRAGLMGFVEHASYRPIPREPLIEEDRPLLAAPVPGVDPDLDGPSRLLELAALAHANLLENAELEATDLRQTALLVSLPAADPVVTTWSLARDFVPGLCRRVALSFDEVRVTEGGHAGMIDLLEEAARLLAGRGVKKCVLLGADSYLAADRLAMLDRAYRIKTPRNVDGFIPGEAATCVLLETPDRAAASGTTADAIITGVGTGSEPDALASEKESSGAGLTGAIRALLASGARSAGQILCDLNGESYRAIEWGIVQVRLGEDLGRPRRLIHPANCWGDIGAATGGGLFALAAASFRRGYAPTGDAILFSGNDGALRAAAHVRRA